MWTTRVVDIHHGKDKRLVEMGEIQNPVPFSPINIADPKTITKNKNKIK